MIEITIYSVGTLLLLALGFTGVAVVAYLTYSFPGRIFQWLFLAVASVSVLTTLLSGRVLRLGDSGLETIMEGDGGSTFLGKAMLVILVGVAFSICIAWGLWRFGRKRPKQRYAASGVANINKLTWAFAIYFGAYSLLPLIFAPRFSFHVSLVYPLFVWLALLLSLRTSTIDPVLVVRQAFGMIVVSSLAAAVLAPSLALQPGYSSLIPGFNMRLWGTTAHANTLGSIAGTLLVIQFIEKTHNRILHHLLTISALIVLILTQSKSAMGGALLGLGFLFVGRIWYGNKISLASYIRRLTVINGLVFFGILSIISLWLLIGAGHSTLYSLERHLDSRAVSDLSTLTGRTEIWGYAIKRGMENPIFGQGLAMWDLHARLSTGFSGASNAHNLFLQTFSRAGIIGFIALLILLAIILINGIRSATITRGGSLALLIIFAARSLTEVTVQPNSILGGEFFTFMAVLIYSMDPSSRGSFIDTRKTIEKFDFHNTV